MTIDEDKYNTLFITKFKANKVDLRSEFKRIIDEHGQTEEIKLQFYKAAFNAIISQFKKEVSKDENYENIITTLYNYFIDTLKEDGIDASKFEADLEVFKATELPTLAIQEKVEINYIPEYKSYNLNTKYGRRKAREQALRNYENGTPEYRQEIDSIKIVVWVIIIIIAIIGLVIKVTLSSK
jgi:hypothetical protein